MTRYELKGWIGGVAGAFGAFMVYPIDLSEIMFGYGSSLLTRT
jgi:hypothetical protein